MLVLSNEEFDQTFVKFLLYIHLIYYLKRVLKSVYCSKIEQISFNWKVIQK